MPKPPSPAQQARLVAATTESQIVQDQAQANAVLAQGATAQAQANAALQAVQTARNAAAASHQQVNVAQANYTRAQKDADRYTALYGPNGSVAAVTAQQVDQARRRRRQQPRASSASRGSSQPGRLQCRPDSRSVPCAGSQLPGRSWAVQSRPWRR